jgi:ATP-dependent DNA ligase
MIPTDELWGEMKAIDEDDARKAVNDPDLAFERKYDGTFGAVVASIADEKLNLNIFGRGVLKSGEQQDYCETFPDLISSIAQLLKYSGHQGITIIGEIVNLVDGVNESFKAIETRCTRKKDREKYAEMYPATFLCFDILEIDGQDLRNEPFLVRRECLLELEEFILKTERLRVIEQFRLPENKQALLDKVLVGSGIEGIVVKHLDGTYPGKTMKFKYKRTEDVFWEGEYIPGKNRHEGKVGSLICYQYINGNKMAVAKVGGGMTDVLRNEITAMAQNGEVSVDKPRVIEVQTHELLPSGSMRYPNFVRWRFDKTPEQCTRELEIVPTKKDAKRAEKVVKVSTVDDWL